MSQLKWAAVWAAWGKINKGEYVYYLGGVLIRGVDVQRGARIHPADDHLHGVFSGHTHHCGGVDAAPKKAQSKSKATVGVKKAGFCVGLLVFLI